MSLTETDLANPNLCLGYIAAVTKTAVRRLRLQANRIPLATTKLERMAIQSDILNLMDALEREVEAVNAS